MKKLFIPVLLPFLFFNLMCHAQRTGPVAAGQVAESFLRSENRFADCRIIKCEPILSSGDAVLYVFHIAPKGYIVTGADFSLSPVIAFSVESDFGEFDNSNPLYRLALGDALKQLSGVSTGILPQGNHYAEWIALQSENYTENKGETQQWPDGMEGWIGSSWNQGAPYWNMCPMDPVTHARCYTGCPATAMAMILNFHGTTNNTQLTDADDYHHVYAGRNYWIDNDWQANGFPAFDSLNKYLDTLNMHFATKDNITNNDKAALSFACGVAMHQVYTSQGSGTFAVAQAFDGYMRFACVGAALMYPGEQGLFDSIILNMQQALPVHLAVVDESNSSGHNLAIDGYRSDGYFHLDYGYGEYYNGWYLVPSEIQMGLTVIEGVIVNIMKDVSQGKPEMVSAPAFRLLPVPADNVLHVEFSLENKPDTRIIISDVNGKIWYSSVTENLYPEGNSIEISTGSWPSGIYTVCIENAGLLSTGTFIVQH